MTKENSKDKWLAELQVGDKVVFFNSYGFPSVTTVERLTKTKVVLKNMYSVKRASGSSHDNYRYTYIYEPTKELLHRIEIHKRLYMVRGQLDNIILKDWSKAEAYDKIDPEKLKDFFEYIGGISHE